MKEKIVQLAKGQFDYALVPIILSQSEIELEIEEGKKVQGYIVLKNRQSTPMKGVIYTSNDLISIKEDTFVDAENTIHYEINGKGLAAGEVISGEIQIVSSCGEVMIPVKAKVEMPYCITSLGKIRDLFNFTNLAKEDWAEAMKLFKTPEFERVFIRHERRYLLLYKNLLKGVSTSQAMEEFLIAIHKKFLINIEVDRTKFEYSAQNEPFMDKIVLTKDNWGHLEMKATTDVPFIQLEHKIIWADNFIGSNYNLEFVILPAQLKKGRNFGQIYIKTMYQEIIVTITCIANGTIKHENREKIKKGQIQVIHNYLEFRTQHISFEKYIADSEDILKNLSVLDPQEEMYELLMTHIFIMDDRRDKVEQILLALEEKSDVLREKSVVCFCGFLYLKALYSKDNAVTQAVLSIITKIYEEEYHGFELLWFLLYLDKKYENNHTLRLAMVKEQTEKGCHSPVLYYEAVSIYNKEPSILHELGEFEIQVLNFGIQKDYLSKDVAIQYTYLATREKEFSNLIFKGLTALYKKHKLKDILSAICSTLIKGQRSSMEDFEWYKLGVESQLKITQLHEYYMYSIDETADIPLASNVLLYFMYNSNLPDNKKAYLYASIIKNKEKNGASYRAYLKQIENFGLKQIVSHTINENLAVIYSEIIDKENLSARLAKELPYILFKYKIKCDNPNIKGVEIIHQELQEGTYVPLCDGEAQISIFTENAEVFLVDQKGNRYITTMEYSLKRFMVAESYLNLCYTQNKDNEMLLLYLSDKMEAHLKLDRNSLEACKKIMEIPTLSAYYKRKCRMFLVNYFYDNDEGEELEHYLLSVDLYHVGKREKNDLIEYTIIRRLYDKALEEMNQYGYHGVSVKRILKLCTNKINSLEEGFKEEFILKLCHYVFQSGKYDETVLKYLTRHYEGTTKDMFEIWKAASELEIDTVELEERLLGQILFAESYVCDVFRVFISYYEKGKDRRLIRAFLNFYSYKYLVFDRVVQREFFDVIKKELDFEENDIVMLALLKYLSVKKDITEPELIFAEYNIHQFLEKDFILPFFRNFKGKISLPEYICDKYFVRYGSDPNNKVFIYYMIVNNGEEEFIKAEMKNVYMGIYVKEFVLFYNEELQYYITEESDGEEYITQSMVATIDCDIDEDENRYNIINLLLMTKDMKDEKTLVETMEHYIEDQYLAENLFHTL